MHKRIGTTIVWRNRLVFLMHFPSLRGHPWPCLCPCRSQLCLMCLPVTPDPHGLSALTQASNQQVLLESFWFLLSLSLSLSYYQHTVTSDSCGGNFPEYVTMPRYCCSSFLLCGLCTFLMAATFSGSGLSPSSVSRWPMYLTSLALNVQFSGFSCMLLSLMRCITFSSLSSCCCSFSHQTNMSSTITSSPSKSSNVWDIIL